MQKSVIVNNQPIYYKIRVSKKAKYLQLRILPEKQLELVIPRRYSLKEGERFVSDKSDWIQKHFVNLKSLYNFYLFGNKLKVEHHNNFFVKRNRYFLKDNILKIDSPINETQTTGELFNKYLKSVAKNYLPERITELAIKHKFKIGKISLRGQITRWGSCSTKGNLSFNYKLLQYDKSVIDYVIIHELCHTRQMNHSQKFWKLVEEIMPDYKIQKRKLRGTED